MKNLLILLSLFTFSICNSQNIPGIYYNNKKLSYSRITGNSIRNIAGAYFSIGISPAKSYKIIEGTTSELGIKNIKPTFTIVFGEDKETGYIFSSIKNMNNIFLVRLGVKNGNRRIKTGKYGITGIVEGLGEDIIPIAIEKIDDNSIKITPKNQLLYGEYCFYYNGKPIDEKNTFSGVYDFTIK